MRDRYYISFNAGVAYTEFFPTNTPKIQYRKQSGEIFKRPFVDKFKIGRLKNATVFDIIAADFYDKTKFTTEYWYKIEVLGVDKFYFIGPVTDGKLEDEMDVYEVTPEPRDTYRDILQQYDKKWQDRTENNIFGLNSKIKYPILITTNFANVNFSTFSNVAHLVTWTNTAFAVKQRATHVHTIVSQIGDIYILQILNYVVVGNDVKTQLVNAAGTSLSNEETITSDGFYYLTQTVNDASVFLEISEVNILPDSDPASGSFDYVLWEHDHVQSGNTIENILNAVINDASYMNLGLTINSTYLWNDILPTGHAVDTPNISTYITANPTNDYIIEGSANWNYLWLARNDDFTTAKEDITELSLKNIMDFLKIKLRAWWFIDPDGHFRIEHEYYFRDFSVQANLTSATYAGDKPEVDARLYSYKKGDIFSQINYKELNQSHEDWIPYPIEYSMTLTSNKSKDISLAYFGSDLECLIDSPDDASSSGWILLRCFYNGTNYFVNIDASTLTPANYYANARLGWAYLFANYWDYFAEAEDVTFNGGAHTFTHVKEFLKQDNVRFHMTSDLDWKKPFTLLNGTGWIEEAEYIPETGVYNINFGFNPYA